MAGSTKKAEPRHLAIAALLANPTLKGNEIAEMLGVHPGTVSKVKKTLQESLEQNSIAIAAYQMLLRDKVPSDLRVSRLKEMVESADKDITSLKAIQYVDECLRLTPRSQSNQQDADINKPMFVLPSASTVVVNLGNPKPEREPGEKYVMGLRIDDDDH